MIFLQDYLEKSSLFKDGLVCINLCSREHRAIRFKDPPPMLLMTEEWQFSERWWILIQMESSSLEDLNIKPKTIKTQEKKKDE